MEIRFRQNNCFYKDLDIDEIEVMTTDTHTVNTISRDIINWNKDEIIEYVKNQ